MTNRFLGVTNVALVLVAVFGFGANDSFGGVLLNSLIYSQNFDGATGQTLGPTTTGHWSSTAGTQNAVPGDTGWDGVKLAGTGTTNMNFNNDDGNLNAGAIYSYGAVGSGERALGSIASGTNIPAIGVELINNTGNTINSVTISYRGEYWRSSTSATNTPNTLTFGYFVEPIGGATSANYLSLAGALSDTNLDLPGPAPVPANGPLDGNANGISRSSTISGISLAHGDSLFIRWQDLNEQGNDAGLAIDSVEIRATHVPTGIPLPPAALVFVGVAAAAGVARRRIQGLIA
jgi:hypothetical protein